MSTAEYDVTIDAGATFTLAVTWTNPDGSPIDMTGYRVRAEFVKTGAAALMLDADSANPVTGITVSTPGVSGEVTIAVSAALTAALDGSGRYLLDVTAPNADVFRILRGAFVVAPGAPV